MESPIPRNKPAILSYYRHMMNRLHEQSNIYYDTDQFAAYKAIAILASNLRNDTNIGGIKMNFTPEQWWESEVRHEMILQEYIEQLYILKYKFSLSVQGISPSDIEY